MLRLSPLYIHREVGFALAALDIDGETAKCHGARIVTLVWGGQATPPAVRLDRALGTQKVGLPNPGLSRP
jgi:hypothetical protein